MNINYHKNIDWIEDNHYDYQMLQKMLEIKLGNLRPPKEELEEMIEHFTGKELYNYCAYLKETIA